MMRVKVSIEPVKSGDRYPVLLDVKRAIEDKYLLIRENGDAKFVEGGRRVSSIGTLLIESPGMSIPGGSLDFVIDGMSRRRVRDAADALSMPSSGYPVRVRIEGPYELTEA